LSRTILAIDVGSTKICAIIAQVNDENDISIIGAGINKAQGLKKGSITNIELASKSIRSAVNDAKRVSGSDVKRQLFPLAVLIQKALTLTA
jgi:cell division protein FtsA